jgi:protein involved in polysaccharide export with SLBB domain
MTRHRRWILPCLALALVACSSGMPPRTLAQATATGGPGQPCPPTSIAGSPKPFVYRLGIGDELTVGIWQEKDVTATQRVLPDGTISPPMLSTVHVAGRTLDEARNMLIERYKEYFKEPLVSVRVTAIHSDRVFVLGEVKDPQAVPLVGPTTLAQTIAQAGGFEEEFANKGEVRIVRKGPGDQPYVTVVNLDAVLAGRAEDPPMRRGDVVWVPARGVTNFNRSLGQALAPFSIALGVVGSTAAIVTASN